MPFVWKSSEGAVVERPAATWWGQRAHPHGGSVRLVEPNAGRPPTPKV